MKERLVDDWLSRINERGYDVAFCQTLIAKGQRVLRCGHSPIEHGKDVLALSADGSTVWGYQLKTGNCSQAEIMKHHDQLKMLVETRPIFPGLPENFIYCPVLVITGEFKDPAISLIKELNAGWRSRQLPELKLFAGRAFLSDLISLSHDFWPITSPDIRNLRSLYLVDGRGDFDAAAFGDFFARLIDPAKSPLEFGRQAAAANVFASYLLGEFHQNGDHWSVFRGWTICAAAIARATKPNNWNEGPAYDSFVLARNAAFAALSALTCEVIKENALHGEGLELDDYTKVRNTTALAAAACSILCAEILDTKIDGMEKVIPLIQNLAAKQRFHFWGEGALSQYAMLIWALDRASDKATSRPLLADALKLVVARNQPESEDPLADPYQTPDDCLMKQLSEVDESRRKEAVESYALYPLVLLGARRQMRQEIESIWHQLCRVRLTWFRGETPADALQWHCERGREITTQFEHPQSWRALEEIARRQDRDRLPPVLWEDMAFSLMFLLTFQHRMLASLFKHIDDGFDQTQSDGVVA
jgi:hypothetical protein